MGGRQCVEIRIFALEPRAASALPFAGWMSSEWAMDRRSAAFDEERCVYCTGLHAMWQGDNVR